MAEAGKGSKQRPTDQESYSSNWDKIFGKPNETVPKTLIPLTPNKK